MGLLLKRRAAMGNRVKMELVFDILTDGEVVWKATGADAIRTIQYSRNGRPWETITSTLEGVRIPVRAGEIIGWQGHNNAYCIDDNTAYSGFGDTTARFNVRGNIMALVDEDDFDSITTLSDAYTFAHLFQGCTTLVSASGVKMQATILSESCYRDMFSHCTSMVAAPSSLPATSLAVNCYRSMFNGNTALISIPSVLPATTCVDSCYYCMFMDCASIITAPSIMATTLANSCCDSMFSQCYSLTTPPTILPALTCATKCYYNMFNYCTSLRNAPQMSATTLADQCYEFMFQGCHAFVDSSLPSLPVTTLAISCYQAMFKDCPNITTAPVLPATTTVENCYMQMFMSCTSLVNVSNLPATFLAKGCYADMFNGCSSLQRAPEIPVIEEVNQLWPMDRMFQNSAVNYVKCLIKNAGTSLHFADNWLKNVAQTGTFVKHPDANWPRYDSSVASCLKGIPVDWTIVDADINS